MASATLLFFVLMLSSVRVGKSAESLIKLKCQPAVGVIGQTTQISCSIESLTDSKPINIDTVVLTRSGENKPCFTFQPYVNKVTGDSRFKVENRPSLQLRNTAISDEAEYTYFIQTNRGIDKVKFTINVTGKYSNPVITSVPEKIVNGEHADLYCNASGLYPVRTIHWFDQSNTNWTKSATLQSTQGNDDLFTLTSKLSFQKINTAWAPYTCVVLNNKYKEEGKSTFLLERKDIPLHPLADESTVKISIAGVVLLGSLIVGSLIIGLLIVRLLIAYLLKRRCEPQLKRVRSLNLPVNFSKDPDVEDEKALNEPD
ncbi:uncharacterized protein LOC128615713 [Ictalurus furcatus]|uniref:uncharacterized protein LOC128615713 n=1 Tax=Ictalurus furcatus TaxID=66913 RepID=UPI00234FBE06|nr:uncharacterized protein LOC128615713 [Ictalurus furcatus]XP_053493987.1 uncharacterized protein LOC128615713 [Ictalurus furcatus]